MSKSGIISNKENITPRNTKRIAKSKSSLFKSPALTAELMKDSVFLAIEQNDFNTFSTLLSQFPTLINACNEKKETILIAAIKKQNIHMVVYTLTKNPELKLTDEAGFDAKYYAEYYDNEAIKSELSKAERKRLKFSKHKR